MKELNVTINFTADDDYDPGEVMELIHYIVNDNYDPISDLNLHIKNYKVAEVKKEYNT